MKRKIEVILIVFILIFSLFVINAKAAELTFTTTMTPSSTTVSEGTEVVVTVSVSNLNVGDSGINAFTAYLSYDSDVFETLTDSSVEGLNSWSSTYTASSGQILLTKNSFVNTDEEIMQITLKVRDGVEVDTEGTVSLTGIVVSNSESEVSGDTVSTTITVGTGTSSDNTNNTNTTGNPIIINPTTNNTNTANEENTANTNANTNTENSSSYNVSNLNTNSSNDDIPYTGPVGDAFIKIILGVVLIALVIYIKIRKMDEIK